MKVNSTKKRLGLKAIILFQFFVCVLYLMLTSLPVIISDNETGLYTISVIGTISFVISIYLYYRATGILFSPYLMFYSAFFIFQLGQCLLITLGVDYDNYVFNRYNHEIVIKGIVYSFFCTLLFNFGSLLSLLGKKSKGVLKVNSEKIVVQQFLGKLIFFITLIPAFFNTIREMVVSIKYGYFGMYTNSIDSFFLFDFLQLLFIPSGLLLLSAGNYKDTQSKIIQLIIYIYASLLLVTGGRTEGIAVIITLLCLRTITVGKFTKKNLVRAILVLAFVIMLIPTFANFRNIENKNFISFFEEFGNSITSNPIVETIGEMGYSISPLFMTMGVIPDKIDFQYGESYLASIASVIPSSLDFTGNISKLVDLAALDNWLLEYYGLIYGPGYSMIAESYYNFGYMGIFVIFLWGLLIGKLLGYVNLNDLLSNRFKLYIKLVGLYSLFTFPRRPTIFFVKETVYLIILVSIVYFITYNYFLKNKSKINL